jgi:hypothetical protein
MMALVCGTGAPGPRSLFWSRAGTAGAAVPVNLPGCERLPSIGARFQPKECPLLPGETVAETVAVKLDDSPTSSCRNAPDLAAGRPASRFPRAEAAAGLERLDGGLWHAYRRKWATERKELPLKDVAAAGGWKDVTTLLTCYQHADEATMLKVMNSPLKLMSRRAAGGALEKR